MCFPLGVRGWTLLAPPSPDSLVGRTYDLKKASESLASKIYASSPSPSKRNPVMRYLHSVFQPNRENTVSLNAAEGMSLGFGLPPHVLEMRTPLRLDASVGRTANFISTGLMSSSTKFFAPNFLIHSVLNLILRS